MDARRAREILATISHYTMMVLGPFGLIAHFVQDRDYCPVCRKELEISDAEIEKFCQAETEKAQQKMIDGMNQ